MPPRTWIATPYIPRVTDRRIRRSGRTCPTAYAYGCLYNVAGVSNPLLLARKELSSKAFSDRRSASRAIQSVKEARPFIRSCSFPWREAASSCRRYACLGAGGGAGDVLSRWKEGEAARYDRAAPPHAAGDGAASAARDGRSHQPRTGRAARHSPGHCWHPSRPRAGQAESA
jgi:hypothetical protein